MTSIPKLSPKLENPTHERLPCIRRPRVCQMVRARHLNIKNQTRFEQKSQSSHNEVFSEMCPTISSRDNMRDLNEPIRDIHFSPHPEMLKFSP